MRCKRSQRLTIGSPLGGQVFNESDTVTTANLLVVFLLVTE